MKYFIAFAIAVAFLFCHVYDLKAQWIKTNGPCGSSGVINSIAIDNLNIFVASNRGIYRSTDKGNSWSFVYSMDSSTYSITSLAINSSYVYAGTNLFNSYGILRSSDNGTSWSPDTADNSPRIGIYALSVHESLVLASSAYGQSFPGMFRSTDNGGSWARILPTGITSYVVQGSKVFAAAGMNPDIPYGVYFSNDTGASWTATNFPNKRTYSVAVKGTTVFAGTDSSIYKSTDNGNTWNISKSVLGQVSAIVISPSGSFVYAGTNNGVFRSTDLGETWTATNTGITSNSVLSLAQFPAGSADSSYIFAGTNGGIFCSKDNGSTWRACGLPNDQFSSNSFLAASGSMLLAGSGYMKASSDKFGHSIGWQGNINGSVIFLSTDNGSTWTEADLGLAGLNTRLGSLIVNGSDIFAGTYPGGVFISTNGGTSWENSSFGMNNTNVHALVASESYIFAGTTGGGVNISMNNGLNWTASNFGLTDITIYALAISGSNLFAGTLMKTGSQNIPIYNNDVFFTSDHGTTWAKIDSQSTSGITPLITCLSVNGSNVVVGTGNLTTSYSQWKQSGSVYRLTFDGEKWNRSDSALSGNYISSLVSTGSTFFAGTYTGGVFASSNNGVSWTSINDGLTDLSAISLVIHNSNLFAATSSGVWRRPLSEITSVQPVKRALPTSYNLAQNYPDPFNPSTKIMYSVPATGLVTLKVYNILGQEVATLFSGIRNAGNYEATFDGSKLASGVYFYRLQAGNHMLVKKMLMLK